MFRLTERILQGVPLAILCAIPLAAEEGELLWSRQFGGLQTDEAYGVYTDGRSIYAGGIAYQQTGFPGVNGFLRKYDRAGRLLWERQFGEAMRTTRVQAVTGDQTGIYVAGYGQGGAFLRKFSEDGQLLWSRTIASASGSVQVRGAAADRTGVYIVGDTDGALAGYTNAGSTDLFAARFDANGNQLWLVQWGTRDPDYGHAVAVCNAGLALAGHTLVGGVNGDGFLHWLDRTTGATRWRRELSTPSFDTAKAVAASWDGIFVAGDTMGSFGQPGNAGSSDGFLIKYDLEGIREWSRGVRTSAYDSIRGIALRWDQVYVVGTTEGALPKQKPAGSGDMFVRSYDLDGNAIWTLQFGTPYWDSGWAIAARNAVLAAAGSVATPVAGGGVNIDAVLVRLDEN